MKPNLFSFKKLFLAAIALGVVAAIGVVQLVTADARQTPSSSSAASFSESISVPASVAQDPASRAEPPAFSSRAAAPASRPARAAASQAGEVQTPASRAPTSSASSPVSSSSQPAYIPPPASSSSNAPVSSSSQPAPSSSAPAPGWQTGWVRQDRQVYYYDGEGNPAEGDLTIDGMQYRFSGGVLQGRLLTATLSGAAVTDTVQNILSRIVAGEVGLLSNPESYKAQAVAAQSYILFYNARGVVAPAMVDGTPNQAVRDAVAQVADVVVTYGGAPANAVYGASNSGVTNSSAEVGWAPHPYLPAGIESKYDSQSNRFETVVTVGRAEVEAALNRIYNPSGAAVLSFDHAPASWISYDTVDKGGRAVAATMSLDIQYRDGTGESRIYRPTANYFKEKCGLGLRSSTFTVTYNGDETWTFTSYGYGHGVGMSQEGAYRYAVNEGWSYQQILAHYYPGTQLTTYGPPV